MENTIAKVADGRAFLVALETIANWPVAEQDNMQAANMRKLAQDALRGRAVQPASKYDEWAAMLALSEQPEIAKLLEAFSHDSTEDNAVYLVREVVTVAGRAAALEEAATVCEQLIHRQSIHSNFMCAKAIRALATAPIEEVLGKIDAAVGASQGGGK